MHNALFVQGYNYATTTVILVLSIQCHEMRLLPPIKNRSDIITSHGKLVILGDSLEHSQPSLHLVPVQRRFE